MNFSLTRIEKFFTDDLVFVIKIVFINIVQSEIDFISKILMRFKM